MWKFNGQSSLACAHLAAKLLNTGGLLLLTGASPALTPSPHNIAYGMSKAAVHHLIVSVAAPNGLPKKVTVIGIVPIMLDTASNRSAMPGADTSTWTPLPEVANKILEWSNGKGLPATGSFLEPQTRGGKTQWAVVTKKY